MNEWARNLDTWNDRFEEEEEYEAGLYECGCVVDEGGYLELCPQVDPLANENDLDRHFDGQTFYPG